MSAMLLPPDHLHLLGWAAVNERLITDHMGLDLVSQMAYENARSCAELDRSFNDAARRAWVQACGWPINLHGVDFDPHVVYVVCRSFFYQTCEYERHEVQPGWELVDSLAEIIENEIREIEGNFDLTADEIFDNIIHPSVRQQAWHIERISEFARI